MTVVMGIGVSFLLFPHALMLPRGKPGPESGGIGRIPAFAGVTPAQTKSEPALWTAIYPLSPRASAGSAG